MLLLIEKFVIVQKIEKKVSSVDPFPHFHFPEVTVVVVSCVSFHILFAYTKQLFMTVTNTHTYVELQCTNFFYKLMQKL